MKKTLLFFCLLFISFISYAQVVIPKGQKVVGGSISVGTGKAAYFSPINRGPDNRFFQTTFDPSFGWAMGDNQVYGFTFHSGYATWRYDSSAASLTKGSHYAFGPGVFYEHFFNLGKGFNFSANGTLRATYGRQQSKEYRNSILTQRGEGKEMNINFSITPRIGYSFNNRWMVQASVGELIYMNYSHSRWKSENTSGARWEHNQNNLSVQTRLTRGLSLSNLGLTLRYRF